MKKIIAITLALAMVLSLAACGGSASGSSSDGAKKYDQVTYAYATFNNIPTEEALDVVEEAINVITREKIGAEITLKPIPIFEYSQSVNLSLQGGEKIDIMQTLGDFNTYLANGMCLDLTDIIDSCAAETKALVGEEWLDACRYQGGLYAIPDYKPVALTSMIIYRQDIADELGLDMSKVNSAEDLTEVFAKIKAEKPEITPLGIVETGNLGIFNNVSGIDLLGDSYNQPVGGLIGNSLEVVDLYTSDVFVNKVKMIRDWYNAGYVMKDAATTTSTSTELMSSGNYFGWIAAYSYPEQDTANSFVSQCGGYPLGAKTIDSAYLYTSAINAISWMLAANTKVPEAALKFLNLTYTDPAIANLIIWGVEGRDYVLTETGNAAYPDGMDANTVPYTAQISCGIVGNQFIQYLPVGSDYASLDWELEQNKLAPCSPAMGFAFDSADFTTQYTAVRNVLTQYLPGLYCGSVDPDTEIPKMIEALNAAGYQDILAAKQAQLNAWAGK